jgi:hypothetical protein
MLFAVQGERRKARITAVWPGGSALLGRREAISAVYTSSLL